MILGKWNKSVILTYVGMCLSICAMYFFTQTDKISYGLVCFMFAGVCDLFDGTVARMCKRTKDEKQFGIELDSLIDVFNFIALPIVFFFTVGMKDWYFLPLFGIYGIFGIARLAHFNVIVENDNKPVPYYHGLPVTYAAMIFPISYLLTYVVSEISYLVVLSILIVCVSLLYIIDLKVPKPKLKMSIFLLLLAIVLSVVYLFVL